MKTPGWITGLRVILRYGRQLDRIAKALERIADSYEGIPPPARPAPPEDHSVPVAYNPSDADFAHFERTQARLAKILGREPTPEEVERELDGIETSPEESAAAWRERRPDLRRPDGGAWS
jgi:hypothetical protein